MLARDRASPEPARHIQGSLPAPMLRVGARGATSVESLGFIA
jgi:hypothetical protein